MRLRITPIFVAGLLLALGCSSSTSTPATDASTDTAPTDTSYDALANTCTPAGGTCIALTATSKCPDGTRTPTDAAIHCAGEGAMCCVPGGTDGGADGDAANACEAKGGTCIPLTATSKCPTGSHSASDPCSGAGAMCCQPDVDASTDAGAG